LEKAMKPVEIIRFEDVDYRIGGVPVLEEVRFSVRRGEFLYVIGPNGGGKTTLLKLILGLIRPDQGNVQVFSKVPPRASSRIGYLPQYQHFDPLFPVTVLNVVLMGRIRRGLKSFYSRQDKQMALSILGALGLASLPDRPFSALSGGQRQRVLIARALVHEPELLLLDEPMSNADVHIEEILFDLLGRLTRRMTILMVTHDYGFVPREVQRVVCVNQTVAVHPTRRLTGGIIQNLYQKHLSRVHHDRNLKTERKNRG
jgi:zinc transport system ATP-binding protein